MTLHYSAGVGVFRHDGSHWQCVPHSLPGIVFQCDTSSVLPWHDECARSLCRSWDDTVRRCLDYIERQRSQCHFQSRTFSAPSVLFGAEAWIVFFETEVEAESVFGVEFRGDDPFQLVIGD